jgi:hypothetical protein
MHISIDNHSLSVLSVKEITEGDLAELLFTRAQYLLSILCFQRAKNVSI